MLCAIHFGGVHMKRFLVLVLAALFSWPVAAQAIYPLTAQSVTTTATIAAGVPSVLVPANPVRKAFAVWNNGGNSAYVSQTNSGTCSASTPDKIVATFSSWEQWGPAVWTGAICSVRNAGSGTYTVKEYW